MNKLETFGYRGNSSILKQLILNSNEEKVPLNIKLEIEKSFNLRFIFDFDLESKTFPIELFGEPIYSIESEIEINSKSELQLQSEDELINFKPKTVLEEGRYNINICVYEELPNHSYGVLETIPIPKNILNIYINFSLKSTKVNNENFLVQKHFDGFSHLGFLIVDLPKMKEVIEDEYGKKQLDLVYEFSNSEIIEKLFHAEIIMITWGINPFTYPIYSTNNIKKIEPLVGKKFNDEGVFNLTEEIEYFSIIPGADLKNWHEMLEKDYPKIRLFGKGKKTHLSPYALTDNEGSIIISSFVIYRSQEVLKETKPLLNIDLLYDNTIIS
ncbi:hypothetical protein V6246_05110 [Algibacter sp. TI.3.09]|uniref:hypothetical protein n=1 Tax=Algibacter sp. TI.3.09 TaxID=3121298 RepID=UPI00312014A5